MTAMVTRSLFTSWCWSLQEHADLKQFPQAVCKDLHLRTIILLFCFSSCNLLPRPSSYLSPSPSYPPLPSTFSPLSSTLRSPGHPSGKQSGAPSQSNSVKEKSSSTSLQLRNTGSCAAHQRETKSGYFLHLRLRTPPDEVPLPLRLLPVTCHVPPFVCAPPAPFVASCLQPIDGHAAAAAAAFNKKPPRPARRLATDAAFLTSR